MRNAMLALLALSAAGAATIAGSGPAAAFDYPYCPRAGVLAFRATVTISPTRNAWRARPDDPPIVPSIRASPSANSGADGTIGIITTTEFRRRAGLTNVRLRVY
jgi:hypothetical protein